MQLYQAELLRMLVAGQCLASSKPHTTPANSMAKAGRSPPNSHAIAHQCYLMVLSCP